jgi:hypothetical protein
MNRSLKIILIFLAVDAVLIGGYFGYRALSSGGKAPMDAYEWKTMDVAYQPQDAVEEFIKNDAGRQNFFPVYIRNFRQDRAVLKRFRGQKFARASESVLNMTYPGNQDWVLIEIKYKNEKQQEVQRTILYLMLNGTWLVADSGRLAD